MVSHSLLWQSGSPRKTFAESWAAIIGEMWANWMAFQSASEESQSLALSVDQESTAGLPLVSGNSCEITVVASSDRPTVMLPELNVSMSPLYRLQRFQTECLSKVLPHNILKDVVLADTCSEDLQARVLWKEILVYCHHKTSLIFGVGFLTRSPKPLRERFSLFRISSAKDGGRMIRGPLLPITWKTFPWHC